MSSDYLNPSLQKFFDELAPQRDSWIKKNNYYYQELFDLHRWLVGKNKRVLDIGCGTGKLLASLSPAYGEGIDFSHEMIKMASTKYPELSFKVMDAHHLEQREAFDYVLLSNLVGYLDDVWLAFRSLRQVCDRQTRIVITSYNYLWQPLLAIAEKLHLKMPDRIQNWLPQEFISHFLYLNGFEVIKKGHFLHWPFSGPGSYIFNNILAFIPFLRTWGLIEYIVARPIFPDEKPLGDVSVSIIVPTHEEAGNIETIVRTIPKIGKHTEVIFVDLPGNDGTEEKIKTEIKKYRGPLNILHVKQQEKTGKIGALRLGVEKAKGEIILIYDADATIPAEDLNKFYHALIEGKGDIINGTRLVYPTERGAMRFINHIGNSVFAKLFTWGLGQHFTDTLCGSKGFWKRDFEILEETKKTSDDQDRFGDFYLLLGAYRRNLKIAEVPVRYKQRRYGDTKLNRFRNGWQFLRMYILFIWKYKILREN